MAPLLFYDRLRISGADVDETLAQAGQSSFHDRVACTLGALLESEGAQVLVRDARLPAGGRDRRLESEAKRIADVLISEAAGYTSRHPTLVKPSELKRAMRVAYVVWMDYNQKKLHLLHRGETYAKVLIQKQSQSLDSLQTLSGTPVRDISQLLASNLQLKTVLQELIRNALLISDLADDETSRSYDPLVDEFIPTLELVERVRVFRDLPSAQGLCRDFAILSRLYDFRLAKTQSKPQKELSPLESIQLALGARRRFADLRKRLAELDAFIRDHHTPSEPFLKEVSGLIREIGQSVDRIGKVGGWSVWASNLTTAYVFAEMVFSSSPELQLLLKALLFNPYTTRAITEALQNLALSGQGFKPTWSGRISLIRSSIIPKTADTSSKPQYRDVLVTNFGFWV